MEKSANVKRAENRKRRVCSVLSGIAVIAWMIVIIAFSAQPSTESAAVSGRVSYRLVEGWNNTFHLEQSEEELRQAALRIDFPVRKCAHMSEYAILAALVLAAAACRGERMHFPHYGIALLTAFLYACTDEFHQRFVSGRSGSFTDVLIDTAGAAIGLLVIFLLTILVKKLRKPSCPNQTTS